MNAKAPAVGRINNLARTSTPSHGQLFILTWCGALPTDLRQQVLRLRHHVHHLEELLPRCEIL